MEKKEGQKAGVKRQPPKPKRLLLDGQDKVFALTQLLNSLIKELKEDGGAPEDCVQNLVECRDRLFNCHVQRQQSINQAIR